MVEVFKGRNSAEFEKISAIADTDHDGPVLMINLNRYVPAADFPNGTLYTDYMAALNTLNNVELAQKVHASAPTCLRRVQRLVARRHCLRRVGGGQRHRSQPDRLLSTP